MRVVWLTALLALAGCGDDAAPTDAAADAGIDTGGGDSAPPIDSGTDAPIPGRTFWIADDGDDAADGSEAAPWATFSHAIAGLRPGDTLVAKAGSTFGRLRYDCVNNSCDGEPCPNGERGAPITVRAESPRTVELSNLEEAVEVRGCSHVVIDGFEAHQRDEMSENFATIALVTGSDHVVLRDMVVHTLNRWPNGHVVFLADSSHVLFEDSEIYDFHRGGVIVHASEHVTVRRVYVNGRDTPNLPDPAFNCCCASDADYGLWVSGSFDVTIENVIVERVCEPFVIIAQENDLAPSRAGKATRILGSVALTTNNNGFAGRTYCEDADPCPEVHRVSDLEIIHSVSIDAADAFNLDAVRGALLRNVTAIESRDDDFDFGRRSENVAIDDSNFLVVNALDVGAAPGTSYEITDQAEGAVLSSNSWGADAELDPMFAPSGHEEIDPALGGCYLYAPEGSPMRGAGAGGEDIGARIVNRYHDGVLTDQPLWDPATGAFPCGAIVDGVNDEATFPQGTCRTVHERLHVGASGCPLP